MYNPEQKQIILKNSFGVSYHVFYESGRGICLRMLSDSYIWSRGFVLAPHAVNDFSVTLDKDDFFHFVFQSVDGSIMYGHGRHGQIEIKPILNSKDTTPWQKHVSLLISRDTIIIFYKIRYSGRHLISMQTIKNNIVSKPVAVDYADGTGSSYIVFLDNDEKCHLFYTTSGSSKMHLLYRKLKDDCSIFYAPKTIYSSDGNILFPSGIADPENKIHLLFQVHLDNSYEIIYKNVTSVKTVQTLYKSVTPSGYTGLINKSDLLYSYRVTGSDIRLRLSRDGGKSWADELPLQFNSGGQLTCFTYNTNVKKERNSIYSSEVPGDFSHGYRLALLNDEMPEITDISSNRNATANAFHTSPPSEYIAKGRKKPDKNYEHYENKTDEQFTRKIENRILQLQNITENMQRDLTKHWLLFRDFEKKLDKISGLNQDSLKSYQNEDEFEAESEQEPECEAMQRSEPEREARLRSEPEREARLRSGSEFRYKFEPEFENESENGYEYESDSLPKHKSMLRSKPESGYKFDPEFESKNEYEYESEYESLPEHEPEYGYKSEYESLPEHESEYGYESPPEHESDL